MRFSPRQDCASARSLSKGLVTLSTVVMKNRKPEMTKTFWSDIPPVVLALILLLCAQSWINAAPEAGGRVVGAWKSYSLTNFGSTTAEFRGDGTCRFRESGGAQFSCKWTELGQGQIKIAIVDPGKSDVFFASAVGGDRLYVNEPGREPSFVRADSKFAYERQLLAKATQ